VTLAIEDGRFACLNVPEDKFAIEAGTNEAAACRVVGKRSNKLVVPVNSSGARAIGSDIVIVSAKAKGKNGVVDPEASKLLISHFLSKLYSGSALAVGVENAASLIG
jgi:hypothetical protein